MHYDTALLCIKMPESVFTQCTNGSKQYGLVSISVQCLHIPRLYVISMLPLSITLRNVRQYVHNTYIHASMSMVYMMRTNPCTTHLMYVIYSFAE